MVEKNAEDCISGAAEKTINGKGFLLRGGKEKVRGIARRVLLKFKLNESHGKLVRKEDSGGRKIQTLTWKRMYRLIVK